MPASASLHVSTNVVVPMRDGTQLYADVYRPDGPGPFPVLLQRTPYNKTLARAMLDPLNAAEHGFAVVIQDTRGRYTSEGAFYAFRDDSTTVVSSWHLSTRPLPRCDHRLHADGRQSPLRHQRTNAAGSA